MTDELLDSGTSPSEVLQEKLNQEFAGSLREAIDAIGDLRTLLAAATAAGDVNRQIGVRRKCAAWRLVLDALRNELHRQHNAIVPPEDRLEREDLDDA
jgi:hypothetical protein